MSLELNTITNVLLKTKYTNHESSQTFALEILIH